MSRERWQGTSNTSVTQVREDTGQQRVTALEIVTTEPVYVKLWDKSAGLIVDQVISDATFTVSLGRLTYETFVNEFGETQRLWPKLRLGWGAGETTR